MIIYPVNLYNKTLNLADQCLQHNIDYTFHLHKVHLLSCPWQLLQTIHINVIHKVEKGDVLDHFPGLLILKFIFAFGWLEVLFFIKNAYPDIKRRKLLSSRLRRRSKVHGDQILMTSRWFFILDRFLLTKRSDILNSKIYIQTTAPLF